MLITAIGYSQEYYKVSRSHLLTYERGRWVDGEYYYPTDMFIILNGSKITVNATNVKTYMTYGNMETKYYDYGSCHTWNCIDPDGKNCKFMMKYIRDSKSYVMLIMYSYYALEYTTE